jgi:hypothetical protein
VALAATDGLLRLVITGRGGGHVSVSAMRDRVETAGGTVTGRRVGGATVVEVDLPTAPAAVAS